MYGRSSADDGHGRDKKAAKTPTGRLTRVHTRTRRDVGYPRLGFCAYTRVPARNAHVYITQARRRIILIYPEREDVGRPYSVPSLLLRFECVSLVVRVMRPLLGACIYDAFAVRSVSQTGDLR